mgnify:CR=1 FL=1
MSTVINNELYSPYNIFDYIDTSINHLINKIPNITGLKEYFLFYYVKQNFFTNWMSLRNFDITQDIFGFPFIHILTRHSIEAFLDLYNLYRDPMYKEVLAYCSKQSVEYVGKYHDYIWNGMFTIQSKFNIAKGVDMGGHLSVKDWFPLYPDLVGIASKCNKYAHPDTYLPIITDQELKESILRELLITNLYLLTNSYHIILRTVNNGNQPSVSCNQCINPLRNPYDNDKYRCVNCLRERFEYIVNNELVNASVYTQFYTPFNM